MPHTIGCAILYRWRVKAGKEDQFRAAWERITRLLMEHRGALGSRLHRAEDGSFIAYAQWPSRAAREASTALGPIDAAAAAEMDDAVAESEAPVWLSPVADYLVRGER